MSRALILLALAIVVGLSSRMAAAKEPEVDNQSGLRVRFPDPNVVQSPYTWRNEQGSAIAPTGGSYLKGVVTGTTMLRANVDTSINAGMADDDMPSLKVTIDDQPPTFVQFPPGAKRVTLATLTPDVHRYRIEVIGGNQIKPDGWRGTSFQTKIDSLEFDTGATLSPPAVRGNRALILGDSNIQAYFGEASVGPYYKYVDYTLSWPGYVAFAFDAEFGQIGIGSTGWIHPGQGGYPAMPEWWDHYSAGYPRDLALQPDYVWMALGANDHNVEPAKLEQTIVAWLAKARQAFPVAQIFLVVPFHGENRAAVTAAAAAAKDARVHLVDLGQELQSAIPFRMGQATWLTGDGLHLRAVYQGLVATAIARQSQAALFADPKPAVEGRQTIEIEGWTVLVSDKLLAEDKVATERALDLLRTQLREIVRVVPAAALVRLQKVPLWFSPEYPGVQPKAEYHPGAGWLRDNGRDPAMAKGVEFTNVRIFERETKRMPNFALHELAHAYHDLALAEGFDNPDVKSAFEDAKAAGLYEEVEQRFGDGRTRKVRAYAITNPREYFAETSEAFFSTNDFFPFTREQLAKHDPDMFAVLKKLWGQSPDPR